MTLQLPERKYANEWKTVRDVVGFISIAQASKLSNLEEGDVIGRKDIRKVLKRSAQNYTYNFTTLKPEPTPESETNLFLVLKVNNYITDLNLGWDGPDAHIYRAVYEIAVCQILLNGSPDLSKPESILYLNQAGGAATPYDGPEVPVFGKMKPVTKYKWDQVPAGFNFGKKPAAVKTAAVREPTT